MLIGCGDLIPLMGITGDDHSWSKVPVRDGIGLACAFRRAGTREAPAGTHIAVDVPPIRAFAGAAAAEGVDLAGLIAPSETLCIECYCEAPS